MLRVILRKTGGVLIAVAGLGLLIISAHSPAFSTWYASYVFPVFRHTVGRFFGLFPYSVFEILLVSAVLGIPAMIVFAVVKKRFLTLLVRLSYILAAIFAIFVLMAGINYNRAPFADRLSIEVRDSPALELERLYFILVERADLLSQQIETDDLGRFVLQREGLYDYAIRSMRELNGVYGGLGTFFPRANAPVLSRVMSHMNITGFFSPWTLEAHYNREMPETSIPFVINHELAHAAGHMREDEANFIAYLASRNFENVDFQYSAVFEALRYTLNALNRAVDRERYAELFAMLPDQIRRDFAASREFWQQFQGRAADVATRANDAYLRMNRQEDGVKSYGRMVDLLLAYYRNN